MELLVTDRLAGVRGAAVSGGVFYPDDEQLLRLARDRSANVRWAVIFRVDVPREALEWIAVNDDDLNGRHARHVLDGSIPQSLIDSVRARREYVRGIAFSD